MLVPLLQILNKTRKKMFFLCLGFTELYCPAVYERKNVVALSIIFQSTAVKQLSYPNVADKVRSRT